MNTTKAPETPLAQARGIAERQQEIILNLERENAMLREALADSTEMLIHVVDENDEGAIADQVMENQKALTTTQKKD